MMSRLVHTLYHTQHIVSILLCMLYWFWTVLKLQHHLFYSSGFHKQYTNPGNMWCWFRFCLDLCVVDMLGVLQAVSSVICSKSLHCVYYAIKYIDPKLKKTCIPFNPPFPSPPPPAATHTLVTQQQLLPSAISITFLLFCPASLEKIWSGQKGPCKKFLNHDDSHAMLTRTTMFQVFPNSALEQNWFQTIWGSSCSGSHDEPYWFFSIFFWVKCTNVTDEGHKPNKQLLASFPLRSNEVGGMTAGSAGVWKQMVLFLHVVFADISLYSMEKSSEMGLIIL